jgi:hypothetical protein
MSGERARELIEPNFVQAAHVQSSRAKVLCRFHSAISARSGEHGMTQHDASLVITSYLQSFSAMGRFGWLFAGKHAKSPQPVNKGVR